MTRAPFALAALALALSLGLAASACATPGADAPLHHEARSYDAEADASAAVNAALSRAAARGTLALVVLGANWCHDSRALAGTLASPRFAPLIAERYELVFVDVGKPQNGEGRNLDLASRFGLNQLVGTPALLVLRPDGTAVNLATAATWRNAASRSEDAIFAELTALAAQK